MLPIAMERDPTGRDGTGHEHRETGRVVLVSPRDWPSSPACLFFCGGVVWSWLGSQHRREAEKALLGERRRRYGLGCSEGKLYHPCSADAKGAGQGEGAAPGRLF